jgi:hypothetical protein
MKEFHDEERRMNGAHCSQPVQPGRGSTIKGILFHKFLTG